MAIIRLDCNLNGGDSVTPNNELFYRIYGDVDAYTTPIHTTGTALSDANVTVNNDNVIITGVDGTTNTEFKIAAVDGAGNEGIISDAASSLILFEDDFAASADPMVTNNKWTVINPQDTYGNMYTADGRWKFHSMQFNPGGDVITHQADAKITFDISTTKVVCFDMQKADSGDGTFLAGLFRDGLNEKMAIQRGTAGTNEIKVSVVDNTVETLSVNHAITNILTQLVTFKIVSTGTDVTFYHWTGSWTQLSTVAYAPTGLYTFSLMLKPNASGDVDPSYQIDNLTVSSDDFLTQYPEQ